MSQLDIQYRPILAGYKVLKFDSHIELYSYLRHYMYDIIQAEL